jgi:hypothetical protein
VKEGWGLVVSEAGQHGVPTVGYRSAGGLRESVLDGRTGLLVDDLGEFTAAVERLLADGALRREMGRAAARHAAAFTWPASVAAFAGVLAAAVREREKLRSAAGAVVQDVGDGLVALLDDAAVRIGDRLDADDRDGSHGRSAGEAEQDAEERLHAGTRFRRGRRRSGTVDARKMIHNTAPPTVPRAQA